MRLLLAVVAVLAVAACSSTSAAVTPAGTPSAGDRLAVMVHRAGVGEPYIVQLVKPDGAGGPSVSPLSRSSKVIFLSTPCPPNAMCADSETAGYAMPETSISSTHVYFLDGETQVKAMAGDGTVSLVKNISAPPNSQVMFAVSPDDTRIAVAILTLATEHVAAGSFTEQLYVEDLATTAHRVALYSSTTLAEWPVGWHGHDLLVATGTADLVDYDNPYGAGGFVLIDPATGRTQATMACADGLFVRSGAACVSGGCTAATTCAPATLHRVGWDGTQQPLALPAGEGSRFYGSATYTHLSPEGDRVALAAVTDVQTGEIETAVLQDGRVIYTTRGGGPQGWLDEDHLISSDANTVSVIDLRTGAQRPMTNLRVIPQQGTPRFVGVMPEDLG